MKTLLGIVILVIAVWIFATVSEPVSRYGGGAVLALVAVWLLLRGRKG